MLANHANFERKWKHIKEVCKLQLQSSHSIKANNVPVKALKVLKRQPYEWAYKHPWGCSKCKQDCCSRYGETQHQHAPEWQWDRTADESASHGVEKLNLPILGHWNEKDWGAQVLGNSSACRHPSVPFWLSVLMSSGKGRTVAQITRADQGPSDWSIVFFICQ